MMPIYGNHTLPKCLTESVAGIDAQNLQRLRLRDEGELLKRQFERPVFWVALHIGIELGGGEIAVDHVAFQLGHVDAVGGEAAERLVERGRYVAHLEDESRHHQRFLAARPFRLTREDDE